MADRYWVGGAGSWNQTTHWSASSGGSGGASVPTSSDNVFFNNASASGNYTVDPYLGAVCANLTISCISTRVATFVNNAKIAISGSLNINNTASPIINTGVIFSLVGAAATTYNIYLRSAFANLSLILGDTSTTSLATYAATSALSVKYISIGCGKFDTAGYAISCTPPSYYGGITTQVGTVYPPSIYFRASTVTFGCVNSTMPFLWNVIPALVDPGTSTIQLNATSTNYIDFDLSVSNAWNNIITSGTYDTQIDLTGLTNCVNLTCSSSNLGTRVLYIGANLTVTGTLTTTSVSAATRTALISVTDIRSNITANAVSLSDTDFCGINAVGSTWTGTRLGDISDNQNITFSSGRNIYWSSTATSDNLSSAKWALTSGGSTTNGATINFPLPQDNVIFDDNSCGATGSINFDVSNIYANITGTSVTKAIAFTGGTGIANNISFSSSCTVTAFSVYCYGDNDTTLHLNNINSYISNVSVIKSEVTTGFVLSEAFNPLNYAARIYITRGNFRTQNYNLNIQTIYPNLSDSWNVNTIDFGSSTIGTQGGGQTTFFFINTYLPMFPGNNVTFTHLPGCIVYLTGNTYISYPSIPNFVPGTKIPTIIAGGNSTGCIVAFGGTTFPIDAVSNTSSRTVSFNSIGSPTYQIGNSYVSGTSTASAIFKGLNVGVAAIINAACPIVNTDYLTMQDLTLTGAKWYVGSHSTLTSNVTGAILSCPPTFLSF